MSVPPLRTPLTLPPQPGAPLASSRGVEAPGDSSFAAMLQALPRNGATSTAVAEVFNQNGFFSGAPPQQGRPHADSPSDEDATRSAAASVVGSAPCAATAAPVPGAGEAAQPVARIAGADDAAAAAPAAMSHRIAQGAGASETVPASFAPPAGKALDASRPPTSTIQARTPRASDAHARQAAAATAALQIALQAGPEGVALVARAQRLSADEQLKVRTAIDALLARHGLRARSITINGQIQSPAGGSGGK